MSARRLLPMAAVLALIATTSACSCGSNIAGELLTIFTAVTYTPDGNALLLDARDLPDADPGTSSGLYLASPPSAKPKRVTTKRCRASDYGSVDCLRTSSDGRSVALLAPGKPATTFELWDFAIAAGESTATTPEHLADLVYDARYSPDGAQLVWAQQGPTDGAFGLFRRGEGGAPVELVRSITLDGGATSSAMSAALLATSGLAYPRRVADAVEIWFQPYDGSRSKALGTLPLDCAGTSMSRCAFVSQAGDSIAWQEKDSGIIHVYRVLLDVDLPLGQGYGFAFTPAGTVGLRMDNGPDTANVQRVDTAVVVRRIDGAVSAQLSLDGETVAYLAVESDADKTWHLWAGPSRQNDRDRDLGIFATPQSKPLIGTGMGLAGMEFSLTADARFVILAAPDGTGATHLLAVSAESGEQKDLGALTCSGCCGAGPQGALVMCLPQAVDGQVKGAAVLDLYDPTTGLKTRAAQRAVDAQPLLDGSGFVVLDAQDVPPVAKVATKDGRIARLGQAVSIALSPDGEHIALLAPTGSISIQSLP